MHKITRNIKKPYQRKNKNNMPSRNENYLLIIGPKP